MPGRDGRHGKDGKDGIGLDGTDGKDGTNGKDGSPDTGEQIVKKLEALPEGKRLSYDSLDDLPNIEMLRNNATSRDYDLRELKDVNIGTPTNGQALTYDSATQKWINSTGSAGPQGAQGAQGATGATGPQGAQGATGSTGPQGAQGNQGVAGATGPQGTQGNQGTQGTQGTQGNQGTQGTQGTQGAAGSGLAVGSISMYGAASAPTDWVLCDGTSYLRAGTYAALFAVIGTAYGSADSTHFNVPDLRGRVPIGVGTGTGGGASGTGLPTGGSALTARSNGSWLGEETHTMTEAELVAHTHTYAYDTSSANGGSFVGNSNNSHDSNGTTGSTGSTTPFNVIQPVMGVTFIIKYQ